MGKNQVSLSNIIFTIFSQGCPGDTADSYNDRLVQPFSIKTVCDSTCHGCTAASCSLSLCSLVWRVCSSDSFLAAAWNMTEHYQSMYCSSTGLQIALNWRRFILVAYRICLLTSVAIWIGNQMISSAVWNT